MATAAMLMATPIQTKAQDWGKLKNVIKDSLSDYIWKKTKRNPMILPIIMEV